MPRRAPSRARLLAAALAVAGAAVALPAVGTTPGAAYTLTAVAHGPGGVPVDGAPGAVIETFETGYAGAGEPTLGVTSEGKVFADVTTKVIRSGDQGATWTDVSPGHATSLDPYLYVDVATDRVYKSDLLATCQLLSWSDDDGATWTTTPAAACTQSDHQTITAGKPTVSTTLGYPRVLYNCSQTVGYNGYSLASGCAKSLDGGLTWAPTTNAFQAPSPYGTGPGSGDSDIPGVCIGDIGPIHAGEDGTLYVPRGWCGQPWLAWSTDEGLTWQRSEVAKTGMSTSVSGGFGFVPPGSGQSEHEAAVTSDKAGNLFFVWVAKDRLPYLAVSRDKGRTWGAPVMIGAPGVDEAWGPAVDVDGQGRVAVGYLGTTTSPGAPWTGSYATTRWSGYVGRVLDPLAAAPTVVSGAVTPANRPLVSGACGPHRCNAGILDFIDVATGPDGSVWGAFVDTAADAGRAFKSKELVVARLRP